MDFGTIAVYTISIGGGAVMGASANVLLAAVRHGKKHILTMRYHEHIPLAAAGAALGLLFAQACLTPPTRPNDSVSMRAPHVKDSPQPADQLIATLV